MRKSVVATLMLLSMPGCDDSEEVVLEATNHSVKEMVACGGMQFAAMRGLAGSVVSEAGYPDIAELLFGETSFEREGDAYVTLLPSGVFTMRFERESQPGPIDAEVFSFESYVTDPVLEHPESIEAWQAGDVDFALHFSGPGPLFDLLDAGRGLQSPIRFQILEDDVWALAWGNQLQGDLREVFGPLLAGLALDSDLDFWEQRDDVDIAYRMLTPRAPILDLLDGGALDLLVDGLEARGDSYTVRPTDIDIRYVEAPRRGLTGTIDYAIFENGAEEPTCTATADYGDGAVYGDLSDDC
jgi:hypothetical protein